jgi:hypothetical protein
MAEKKFTKLADLTHDLKNARKHTPRNGSIFPPPAIRL